MDRRRVSPSRRPGPTLCALALAYCLAAPSPGAAQAAGQNGSEPAPLLTEAYLTPPPEIAEAVLAPRYENQTLRNLDPSGRYFLTTVDDGFPSLALFAKPHHNLGAFQVDPAANRNRRLTTRSDAGFEIVPVDGGDPVRVDVPDGARVSSAEWSPDGSRVAFLAHFDDETHVYVADTDDGDSRRVTSSPVLATWVTGIEWTGDGEHVVTVLVPEGRGAEPAAPAVPETPMVRMTTDEENRLRTYFDLLENPHERRLVEYYSTGQLAKIEVESREVERIGEPAMIRGVDPSPDGAYFRVTRIDDPLSYIVPVSSVGTVEELWDMEGSVLAELEDRETRDGGQGDDDDDDEEEEEEAERRGLTWRVDGLGLVYAQMEPAPDSADEAADSAAAADTAAADEPAEEEEGEGARRNRRQDRIIHWLPPFDSTSTEVVYETGRRMNSFSFDASGRTLFIARRSGGGDNRTETLSAVFLDDPEEEHRIYRSRSEDWRTAPGSLVRARNERGQSVVRTTPDGSAVYLEGTQYFEDPLEDAPRPFLDRVDIRSGEKERVFESAEDRYENVTAVLDDDASRIVVSRESPTEVPQSILLDLSSGQELQLTDNVDHTPLITAARREQFVATRPDGFQSKVEVTLPHDYREGTRLPAMFWFYPREYDDQETYDERNLARYNKNDFPSIGSRSMDILTLRGYAVVEPDLPVVGDDRQWNDNYVQDLRNTLAIVIDSLDARGWVDRGRLGIGGHSYGAFGTANAMVNTPFFKAGIAGDGNYNRSLTPAGFQREPRMLWEAEQIYIEMSPFFFADRLTGALLMYHGMDDHNVGTHPTHSKRLFHALNVLGKTAALYMYPYEDHGPATRETTLDLWARWSAWLDAYVKNAGMAAEESIADDAGSSGG